MTTIADDSTFIRGSVREVVITLSFAVAIVVATIWLFIGSLRATMIPIVAIPDGPHRHGGGDLDGLMN